MEKRKLIKRTDLIIIVIVLAVAVVLAVLLYSNESGQIAQISVDGVPVKSVDLRTAKDGEFVLELNHNVSFKIYDGKICFINVNCPDKLCENVGYISKDGETAICMPNKTVLKISTSSSETNDILVQ